MNDESQERKIVKHETSPNDKITLGKTMELDLTGLSLSQQEELKRQHLSGMLRLNEKAQELGIESQALRAALDQMTETTAKATREDTAVTVTRTQNDTLGRTEIIMGNTEEARRGKLSRSQAGLQDYTIVYIIAAAVVIIVLAVIFNR